MKHRIAKLLDQLLQPPPVHVLPVVRAVVCLAVAVVIVAAATIQSFPLLALGLLAAAALAEAFPVPIAVQPGATSFATVFIVAAGGLYSWQVAVFVGLGAMLLVELRLHRPVVQLAFNASLYTLAGAAAGFFAHVGPLLGVHGVVRGAFAFWVVDVGLLALLISRLNGGRYLETLTEFVRTTWAPLAVMGALAIVLVKLWEQSPAWGLALAPILFTISAFERSLIQAFKRQQQLDRLKEEFVATVSHELRTPLASVYGGAVTLQRLGLDAAAAPQMVELIASQSARLSALVDDVLWAAGRPQALKQGQTFDAHEIARDAMQAVNPGPAISLLGPEGDGGPCVGMPDNVRRILLNLVDNAVKYSPDGGAVQVEFERGRGRAVWAVTDEGEGIPRENRDQIFEKFVRLDPDMHNGVGGTGLGLYISRELARAMGGELTCGDNPHGRGSRFVLDLPEHVSNPGGLPCAA